MALEPSARDTTMPLCPSVLPKYAISRPSGDHRGFDAYPSGPPRRTRRPVDISITHTSEYGRPGRSLFRMLYATACPAGANCTSPTACNRCRSLLSNPRGWSPSVWALPDVTTNGISKAMTKLVNIRNPANNLDRIGRPFSIISFPSSPESRSITHQPEQMLLRKSRVPPQIHAYRQATRQRTVQGHSQVVQYYR